MQCHKMDKLFLIIAFSGYDTTDNLIINCLIQCIDQDICTVATQGSWNPPECMLLCDTLWHMFQCKQLRKLSNRFSHCESYSFRLELEIAITYVVHMSSFLQFSEIVRNPQSGFAFHSVFDNFDKFVNELYGPGIFNFAHGFLFQGLESDEVSDTKIDKVSRTKARVSLMM